MKNKEETIATLEETISNYEEARKVIQNEKREQEIELQKRGIEVDNYIKEKAVMKERYEREFELVSSSLYHLGLNYWNMKMEFTQKIKEKPTWLMKERQKFFNGDF